MAAAKNNAGAKSDKLWRQAILLEVLSRVKGQKNLTVLRLLAKRLVKLAGDGDMKALSEIGDRLDGRPTTEITGPDGNDLTVRFVIEGK